MAGFRVTKYDPAFRLPTGAYSRDEWTSVSDVGRMFGGKVVSYADYIRTETNYVQSVRLLMHASGVTTLRVTALEKNDDAARDLPVEISSEMVKARSVVDNTDVSGDDLDWVVRLALREALWCRLRGPHGFYVHFGYDYYMYIGSDEMTAPPRSMPSGMFVERFESPYHPELAE